MTYTTLAAHCHNAGTPYHVLAVSQQRGVSVQKRVRDALQVSIIGTPLVYCGLAKDVHVYGRSFLHTRDGEISHCQSYQNNFEYNFKEAKAAFIDSRSDLFTEWLGEECVFFGGMNLEATPSGLSHTLPGAANFGHFVFEYLNRLAIFEQLGLMDLPFVVYDCLPPRHLEWLKHFGVRKFLMIPPTGSPAFRKMWVSSAPHYRGKDGMFRFWNSGLHRFRGMASVLPTAPKRIYLGREAAEWRNLTNEPEVKAFLADQGFTFPQMSALSPAEQIALMRSAELVVAVAGAGTILTHFAPEHCAVCVLFPHEAIGTGPWGGLGAAIALGQHYERINGISVPRDNPKPNVSGADEGADFSVDVNQLRAWLDMAEKLMAANQSRNALGI